MENFIWISIAGFLLHCRWLHGSKFLPLKPLRILGYNNIYLGLGFNNIIDPFYSLGSGAISSSKGSELLYECFYFIHAKVEIISESSASLKEGLYHVCNVLPLPTLIQVKKDHLFRSAISNYQRFSFSSESELSCRDGGLFDNLPYDVALL